MAMREKAGILRVGDKSTLFLPKHAFSGVKVVKGTQIQYVVEGNTIVLKAVPPGEPIPAFLDARFEGRRQRTQKGLSMDEFTTLATASASRVEKQRRSQNKKKKVATKTAGQAKELSASI